MDFVIDFNWIIVGIIAIVGLFTLPKLARNLTLNSTKSQRKLQQLDNEYIEELESQLKSAKTTLSNRERGPALEGGELDELIPAFVGDVSQFLPKKLQPFFQDKDLQKAIISKVMENPDRFKPIISKFIKKSVNKDGGQQTEQEMSGL